MKFRVKSTLKYSVQRMTPTKAVRIALLVISDALILNIASFLALWVRFEFHFEQLVRETEYLNNILRFAPYYTAFGLIVFALFKLYTSLWQFASIDEFLKIILACFIVDAGGYAGMHLMHLGIPRSHPVLNGIFLVIMITGVRFKPARTPRAGLKRFRVFFSLQTARSASIKSAILKLRIFSGASRFALTLTIFAAMSEAEWSLLRAEAAQSEANCAGSLPRIIPKC